MQFKCLFICLVVFNIDFVLLESTDLNIPDNKELDPGKDRPIIDEGGLDPKLIKIDPNYKPLSAVETAVGSLLLPGPQLVTDIKDDAGKTEGNDEQSRPSSPKPDDVGATDEKPSPDAENNAGIGQVSLQEGGDTTLAGDEQLTDTDAAMTDDDGHVPLKEDDDRMMTGNEQWDDLSTTTASTENDGHVPLKDKNDQMMTGDERWTDDNDAVDESYYGNDGHVPLKDEGDRMMTGNEQWTDEQDVVTDSPVQVTSAGEDENMEDEDKDDGDDDVNNDEGENVDDHFKEYDEKNYDDEDDYDYEEEDNYKDDDHFIQYDEKNYDDDDDYDYDESDEDTDNENAADKPDFGQSTTESWLEDKDEEKEDNYEYDDDDQNEEGKTEDWLGQDRTEAQTTNSLGKFDDSRITGTTESYSKENSEEGKSEDEDKVDAGKNLMESGHHFDNNIGMFAGTKVSSGKVVELDRSSLYIWTSFISLLLVLVLLFIFWKRHTIERYIVSLKPKPKPGQTQRKTEEERNLLKHEFV